MAHHVVTTRAPLMTKDHRIVKGKYTYRVRCKRCGPLNEGSKLTSEGLAKLCEAAHHIEVHDRHHVQHPADKAHLRTDRKKQKKTVNPRG